MKLCFLASGESVHSYRWIRFFSERGHEIHWISLSPIAFPALEGVKTYDLSRGGGKWKALFNGVSTIRSLLKQIQPDVLHAHYAGSYGLLAALSGLDYILTAWGSDVLIAGKSLIKGALVKWVLHKSSLITCDAQHMVSAMMNLGVEKDKIHIVMFGVETDIFVPGDKDKEILERWNASDKPVVISLRSLEPIYNIESLINAVPEVLKSHPEAVFIIAGDGSEADNLKQLSASLNIQAHTLFTGRYRHDELIKMLRSSDVYVSTSLSDAGIAASTAEAMACGTAVVVTDTGENELWIEDGVSGYTVPARAPGKLADKIASLLADKDKQKSFGSAGRLVIESRNDYAKEMQRMESFYLEFSNKTAGKNLAED